jgi:transposase
MLLEHAARKLSRVSIRRAMKVRNARSDVVTHCWMRTSETLDPATLPRDPDALVKMLLEYAAKLEDAGLKIKERDERLTKMDLLLRRFRRWQFGTKSERVADGQAIFDFYGRLEAKPAAAEATEPAPRARRRPKRGGIRVIPKDLPREVVTEDLPAAEKPCPGCGAERKLIGYEESRQLDHTPACLFERVTRRAKYACDPCGRHVQTAPLPRPAGPFEKGLPGFGLLASVLIGKYCDHLPLYRQSRIFGRYGVEIPRSTLCDWVAQTVILLEPIVKAMTKDVLLSRILRTDDTIIRLLVPGDGKTRQARLWGYLGDPLHNQVVYQFTPNRKQEHPIEFLKNFKGLIQADAYKGYDKLFQPGSERTELGCWAHARRYFHEARDTEPELGGAALGYIRALYAVEAEAESLTAPERATLRQTKALPILTYFRAWLDRESLRLLPQSSMKAAFQYAIGQWSALTRYVHEGEASIDNNAMERALRGVAIGRKNFLFAGSEAGGRWAAVLYSLIESCKLNGVEPYRYLKNVLRQVWTHPQSRIEELMPRLWKPPPDAA